MSSAFSFVGEKTFEEEEERKISLADSSVFFQHPTNEGKKRKEKKRNEHTGTEHSAFGLSRSLSFSFSLS